MRAIVGPDRPASSGFPFGLPCDLVDTDTRQPFMVAERQKAIRDR